MVILCNIIITFALGFIGGFLGEDATRITSILATIYELAVLIPGIALVIRRLHDINKSGWYWFIVLIPIVGIIIFLIFMLKDSINEGNQYGERVL